MQSIRRGRALVLCGILLAPAALGAGLTVRDGVLLKDGKPYRAMGINAVGLADEILAKGKDATRSFQAIEYLGRRHVPFIRFWASYFDNWKPYREDPQKYWRNMDLLVEACEKAGVSLAPTLFWNPWEIPFQFGEFRPAWLDDESQTRRFVDRYTREFVRRYRGRRAVWIWEFANEDNLEWDLPNAMSFLPEGRKDNRNIVRSPMGTLAERTFARNVRKVDRRRPISSGATEVRPGQYRLATGPVKPGEEWGTDTAEQAFEATAWTAPAPVDLLSMHHYALPAGYDPAAMREWLRVAGEWAARLKRPLFLGEFGIVARWARTPDDLDDAEYRAALTDFFAAVWESRAALAAYWAFAPDSREFIGTVGPEYKRFEYVMDLIAEYNAKCGHR
jgi:Cellulase (glycosyl hydrolase family 5)